MKRSPRQEDKQALEGREQLHAVHGRRGEADALRERVVEMQRIVVAGDFGVARQRLRVERADLQRRKAFADLGQRRRRAHASPFFGSSARETSRSTVSTRPTTAPAESESVASSTRREGFASRRAVTARL